MLPNLKIILREVTVLDFSRENIKQILTANRAVFDKNNSSWVFTDGNILSADSSGQTTNIQFKNIYILSLKAH